MMKMRTDLDRLHKVYEAMYGPSAGFMPRGYGQTFVSAHLVAGYVEVGETDIMCIMPYGLWADHVVDALHEVFREHKLHLINITPYNLRSGDVTIQLVFDERQMVGCSRDACVVDFDDRSLREVWESQKLRPDVIQMDQGTWDLICADTLFSAGSKGKGD